jgi:VacB/RNase II family 3'-5' exoribonuclease
LDFVMNMNGSPRARLRAIASRVMRERGLDPDFPADALAQVASLTASPSTTEEPTRDLRALLWCSIDNDDSRDLDQLSVAEPLAGGDVRVLVAVADVDAAVPKGSPCDRHAAQNTTSVYTPAIIFPMLPERLSTDLTSLGEDEDRLSVVVELVAARDGTIKSSDVYGARVRNRAKLAYNAVGAWLEGHGPLPPAAAAVPGMDDQLRIQDGVAQALNATRHEHGALDFESTDVRAVFDGDTLHDLTPERPNRAKSLIENLMIAANGVVARFLDGRGFPSLRRVVRSPERWDRIRALAAETGDRLPELADSVALAGFLTKRRAADPEAFADLSLTVIRLLGSGEYVVDRPGGDPPGHFGLAVRDYTHSTAPNRRYPDVITQRLLKAALAGHPCPYAIDELERLATRCTNQEDAANKVERQVRKSATAMLVESRIGDAFDAIVTGASGKGTFVRVWSPPMEGMVTKGADGLDVGDRVRVRLVRVDIDRGFIDFARA